MADYDLKNLDKSRPGMTTEKSDDGLRPAGVYKHPVSGETLIVQNDPLFGDGQARAAERVGFVFEREAKPGEIKTIVDAPAVVQETPKAVDTSLDDLKGLRARINALEAEAVIREDLAKEAATLKVAEQTGVKIDTTTGDVQEDVQENAPEETTKKGK